MSPRRILDSTLPADLEALRGLRAARWTRESTGKIDPMTGRPTGHQWDRFGPAAQRQQQDLAVGRYGLVDVTIDDPSLDFQVAHSGRTVGGTDAFQAMLSRAGRDFDVLVVGYVSRLGRDLKTAVLTRDEIHVRGAAILFADERLLTSDERQWKEWANETVEAEAYSRRMSRRQKEGHAAKRRLGEPGGRPPFGFRREGKPPRLVEMPEGIELIRSMFRWASEGYTDREIAARTSLKKTHVSEVLTNEIYRGVLRDGSRRAPAIDGALWEQVQEMRGRFSRRHPGPTIYRQYVLSGLLHCRSCGRRLTGHVRRYRHIEACAEFRAARPGGSDWRHLGDSYTAATYDRIVPGVLAHVVANASLIAEVQCVLDWRDESMPDHFALARITRERAKAIARLQDDRDVRAWQAAMERLDREEAEAHAISTPIFSSQEVAEALADMATLFRDAEPATQHRIALALFDRVEVLGPKEVWIHSSVEAEARGWATAMSGVTSVDGAVIRFVRRGDVAAMVGSAAS